MKKIIQQFSKTFTYVFTAMFISCSGLLTCSTKGFSQRVLLHGMLITERLDDNKPIVGAAMRLKDTNKNKADRQ